MQDFPCPGWSHEATELTLLATSGPEPLPAFAQTFTEACDVEAELVGVSTRSELELAPDNAEDITGDLDFDLRLFAAVTGVELTRAEMDRVAERSFTLERVMLARAGRSRKMEEKTLAPHFKLPCRADGTLIDEIGFSRLLDEYYSARGWDLEFGWPQTDQLSSLGLEEVIPELDKCRRGQCF